MNTTDVVPNQPVDFLKSGDPIVLESYFVKHAILPIGTISIYLFTIYVFGPWYMKNKEPFTNMKRLILLYNFYTVAANAWCVYKIYNVVTEHGPNVLCTDALQDCPLHQRVRFEVIDIVMEIYNLKFVEMLDTVFFIMQKKFDHISKLHTFHHSSVPFLIWFSLRTQRRMHLVIYGLVNCLIHVIMYSYYGLSLMGPKFQMIRRWKKYITLLQIVQFVLMLPYFLYIIGVGCATPKSSVVIFILHTALLLYLFSDYYHKSYVEPLRKQKVTFKGAPSNGVARKENGAEKKVA